MYYKNGYKNWEKEIFCVERNIKMHIYALKKTSKVLVWDTNGKSQIFVAEKHIAIFSMTIWKAKFSS